MMESDIDALAEQLQSRLGLRCNQGAVGVGKDEWIVIIFNKVKQPEIKEFAGWPVRYVIGGGQPRARGDQVA